MAKPNIPSEVSRFGAPSDALLPALRSLRTERGVGIALSDYTRDVLNGAKPVCRGLDFVLMEAAHDPRVPDIHFFYVPARLRQWMRDVRGLGTHCFHGSAEREEVANHRLNIAQHRAHRSDASLGRLYDLLPAIAEQADATDLYGLAVCREIAMREGRPVAHRRIA